MARRGRPPKNKTEDKLVRGLDQLAAYQNYRDNVSPYIQRALEEGWSHEKILASFTELAAAKLVQLALNGTGKEQMSALKELLDRTQGRPVEKLEVKGKLEQLSEKELDSLLMTKLAKLEGEDDSADH